MASGKVGAFINANKSKKLLTAGAVIGHGMSLYGGISDYQSARDQGHGQMYSLAKAGTEFAMGELLQWKYPLVALAKGAPAAAVGVAEGASKMLRQMNKTSRQTPFQNSTFKDYNQAFTMRQAGMQMAQASKYNLQQTLLGNEASYLR